MICSFMVYLSIPVRVAKITKRTFEWFDVVIYGINAILISSSANGIADANKGNDKNVRYKES